MSDREEWTDDESDITDRPHWTKYPIRRGGFHPASHGPNFKIGRRMSAAAEEATHRWKDEENPPYIVPRNVDFARVVGTYIAQRMDVSYATRTEFAHRFKGERMSDNASTLYIPRASVAYERMSNEYVNGYVIVVSFYPLWIDAALGLTESYRPCDTVMFPKNSWQVYHHFVRGVMSTMCALHEPEEEMMVEPPTGFGVYYRKEPYIRGGKWPDNPSNQFNRETGRRSIPYVPEEGEVKQHYIFSKGNVYQEIVFQRTTGPHWLRNTRQEQRANFKSRF